MARRRRPRKRGPITKEEILEAVESPVDVMDRKGVTLDRLVDQLDQELSAVAVKHFAFQGVVIDSKEEPDWKTRQSARQDAHKLRGDYPSDKQHHTLIGDLEIAWATVPGEDHADPER